MTPFSIALILVSALLHASWNFVIKRGEQPIEFFFWVFLCGIFLFLPFFALWGDFPAVLFKAPAIVWGLVFLSGLFQTVYFISLANAYREGDLSLVYPLSRSAPLFTQAWAVVLIGEVLSAGGILGIALVMVGLFVISSSELRLFFSQERPLHGRVSRPCLLALTAALASSFYSVIDKVGIRHLHPVYYLWLTNLFMALNTGLFLGWRRKGTLFRVWRNSRPDVLWVALLQGGAYLLVLMAMQQSKVSYVVAFRQVSALFGAGMGLFLLKERHGRTRIAGAAILTIGLFLIALSR